MSARNLVLLTTLYAMQGIPMGLAMGSMPLILQSKGISLADQGIFAIASYPYSMKLLWSPIVDTLHLPRLGRRKSWIVPVQLIMSLLMVLFSHALDRLTTDGNLGIWPLTLAFLSLIALAATQDIAVDGWAIELLQGASSAYGSTCQTIGMSIGWLLSNTIFLALSDPSFCNRFLQSRLDCPAEGVLSLAQFLRGAGVALALATLVVFLWPDDSTPSRKIQTKRSRGIKQANPFTEISSSYRQLLGVLRLPSVQSLSVLLLTYRLAFSPVEIAVSLELIDRGLPRDSVALAALAMMPLEMVAAVMAGSLSSRFGSRVPFEAGLVLRFLSCAAALGLVATSSATAPPSLAAVLALSASMTLAQTLMFTAQGALFAAISDPRMGGAYLTLLNTVANLGYTLPKAAIFWLMDSLTIRQCDGVGTDTPFSVQATIIALFERGANLLGIPDAFTARQAQCRASGVFVDGFLLTGGLFLVVGALFYGWFVRNFRRLEAAPKSKWRSSAK